EDVAALGCLPPTFEPRATEFVAPRADGKADMVTLIGQLIERGHAYEAPSSTGSGGEVLFDVSSMPDYGRLSRRNLEDQQAGARVAVDAHKKNPGDFVLWKQSSPEEPGWESPWGRGRPGWHIECSAMSAAFLGETFDIHGGGLDLIFPHHEHEIAQSRCAHGPPAMANYWLHNGFLQVEGRKMAKSEGNFVTIHELLRTEKFGGRQWPGEVLRLAMLMTHYREPIDFSVRKLEEAENVLTKLRRKANNAATGTVGPSFIEALSDDLDLPRYLRLLNETDLPEAILVAAAALIGIDLSAIETDIDVETTVQRRLALIREKNWAEADRIRDELLAEGIQLKDGKDPATGERVTTWEVKR